MKELIKIIGKDKFLLNKGLLGLARAQLWIGGQSEGPLDNKDERVLRERSEHEAKKGRPGWRISGIEAIEVEESDDFPGWYIINTKDWIHDKYRFMVHGHANVQAPNGSRINPRIRDQEYSWPKISDNILMNLPKKQQSFLYLEPNNAGFCFRIEITPKREIKPAGNGFQWLVRWPEIKRQINKHYHKKEKLAEQNM